MNTIEVQLSEKQYVNASMVILAKKPITWILPFFALLFVSTLLVKDNQNQRSPSYNIFIFLAIFYSVFLPVWTYFRAKKLYNQRSSRAKEKVNYEFQEKFISIRGESFLFQANWNNIYKVTVTKNWVFIWTSSLAPMPIPKTAIWEGELLRLREILDANQIKHDFH